MRRSVASLSHPIRARLARLAGCALLAGCAVLAGCGAFGEGKDETAGWSVQKLYSEAKHAMESGAYDKAFKELATRYPDSKYTPDALARMRYLVNALAAHEVHVARYYMKREAFVAATTRAQYALKTYPQAPATEEGLFILVKSYDALGLT